MPNGITQAQICLDSGKLAGDRCPNTHGEFFISGTEPTEKCDVHQGGQPTSGEDSSLLPWP